MDNATYDALNLTPSSSDETYYSRLRTTQTKSKPSYELQQKENVGQSAIKGAKQNSSKDSPNNTKYIVMLIIMMVIFVLVTFVSIALSITTYSRLTFEQSKVLSQLDEINDDIMSVLTQINTTQSNISQNNIDLTQLVTTKNNISQIYAQLNTINDFISMLTQNSHLQTQLYCGPGHWNSVAYLNMTDPSQQCPPAWREYNTSGVRACGRPVTSVGSCPATSYFIGRQYTRVCGRVIGYQFATPDAFGRVEHNDIDLDGININYGAQRNHIWSYAAGWTESNSSSTESQCPCSTDNGQGSEPPSSIGDNYYCESGNPDKDFMFNHLYTNDPLWDGQQCEDTCCTSTNSPPWFSVQLPAPTNDSIQVSICCDQGTNDEDTPVELIEIYVQ